ncbi:hypothetical protein LSH36_736g01063 [Paralvinella palmiformis]|uniref:RRP15-like protein n=1 Tax=Paralvinella palmiformis TaxID=53620 RepID=A0AAD9J1S1_9ANNE|nr:hypothetical protein LSH36_736g01063 [Paralvinella palmiformis]
MSSKISVTYSSSGSDEKGSGCEGMQHISDADEEHTSSDDISSTSHSSSEPNNNADKDAVFNVMSKILGKHTPDKGSVILSKGATDKQIAKKKKKTELRDQKDGNTKISVGSSDEDSDLERQRLSDRKRQKWLWDNMDRIKPDVLDKEKERSLQRIATRGVVQLFNAVKKQQRIVESKLEEVGPSVRKQDRVIKAMTKGKFLDMLRGTPTSNLTNKPDELGIKEVSPDLDIKIDKTEPSWDILRDDFMLGADMKDWDRTDDDIVHQARYSNGSSDVEDSNT